MRGPANRSGIGRRWSIVAVVVILAIGAYFLEGGPSYGPGGSQTGTGSTPFRTTSIGIVTTIAQGAETVHMDYYNWTVFDNLTVIVTNPSSSQEVIQAADISNSQPKSVNVTVPASGGCTPTGSSPPYKLPATCDPGQTVTILITPPGNLHPVPGGDYGPTLVVTQNTAQGSVQLFVTLGAVFGGSSTHPYVTATQTTNSATVGLGGQSGPLGPADNYYVNFAANDVGRPILVVWNASATIGLILHNSTARLYSAQGQSGNFTYCIASSGNYNVEVYNPDALYNSPTVQTSVNVYEIADSSCTPGG